MPINTRSPYGSIMATAGPMFFFAFFFAILGVFACAVVAFPFGNGTEYELFMFWVLVLAIALTVLALTLFPIAVAVARAGLYLVAAVFFILGAVWTLVATVYLIVQLATCSGNLYCADNILCDGTTSGPYGGPTTRFLVVFVCGLVMLIMHCVGVVVALMGFAKLRRHGLRRDDRLIDEDAKIAAAERRKARRTFADEDAKTDVGSILYRGDANSSDTTGSSDEESPVDRARRRKDPATSSSPYIGTNYATN